MLDELWIRDFRSYKDEHVYFGRRPFVGIVGQNGSGKSTICDAIVYAMDPSSQRGDGDEKALISFKGEASSSILIRGSDLEELTEFSAVRIAEIVEGSSRIHFEHEERILRGKQSEALKSLRQAESRRRRSADEVQQFSEVVRTREKKQHLMKRLARIRARKMSIEAQELSRQEDQIIEQREVLLQLKNAASEHDRLAGEARENLAATQKQLESVHKELISRETRLSELQTRQVVQTDHQLDAKVQNIEEELRSAKERLRSSQSEYENIMRRLQSRSSISRDQIQEASMVYNRLRGSWTGRPPSELYDLREKVCRSSRNKWHRKRHLEEKIGVLKNERDTLKFQFDVKNAKREDLAKLKFNNTLSVERLTTELEEAEVKLSQFNEIRHRAQHEEHRRQIITRLRSDSPGIFDYFSNCIRARDERYRGVIERLISMHKNSIVVDSVDTAIDCCKLLSHEFLGVFTLLPADTVKGDTPNPTLGQAALDLIETNPALLNVAAYVLDGAIVVDTTSMANLMRQDGWKRVEVLTDITASQDEAIVPCDMVDLLRDPAAFSQLELRVSEIRNQRLLTEDESEELEIAESVLADSIFGLSRNVTLVEAKIHKLEKLIGSTSEDILRFEIEARLVAQEIENCEEHFKPFSELHELSLEEMETQSSANESSDLHKLLKIAELNISSSEEAASAATITLEDVRREAQARADETKTHLRSLAEEKNYRERALRDLAQLRSRICELERVSAAQELQATEAWEQQSAYLAHFEEERDKLALFQQQQSQNSDILGEETTYLFDDDHSSYETDEAANTTLECDATAAQIRTQLDSLGSSLYAENRLAQANADMEATASLVHERRLHYNEIAETIFSLQAQRRQEFFKSLSKFHSRIYELYDRVNEGGDVQVVAISDDEPWVEGVSVLFIPPRKSGLSLKQLSGGERALASLCLLIAPSTAQVILLDELDAALDGDNLKKLTDFLASLSNAGTQIIMVSHKIRSFDRCQALVGVWRPPSGISHTLTIAGDGASILDSDNSDEPCYSETAKDPITDPPNILSEGQKCFSMGLQYRHISEALGGGSNAPSMDQRSSLRSRADEDFKDNQNSRIEPRQTHSSPISSPHIETNRIRPGAHSSFVRADDGVKLVGESMVAPSPIPSSGEGSSQ